MPIFEIETPDGTFEVDAPDESAALSALKVQPLNSPQGHSGVPEYVPPGVEGYNPETGMVEHTNANDKLGAFITGAGDQPIIGPAIKAGSAAFAAGAVAPFSGQTFGDIYGQMRQRQEEVARDNPGTALAGNIAGSALLLRGVPKSPGASKFFGVAPGQTLKQRMLASGGSSGLISGTDAAIRGGDPAQVAGSTILGAAVGGAIPLAGTAVRSGYGALRDSVGSKIRGAINPEAEAGRRVASAMRIDKAAGQSLDAQDLTSAARNNQPLMNADLGGETTRALTRAAANQSPEARGAIERAVSDRFSDQGNRVQRMVSRLTGGKSDDLLMIDGLRDMASYANKGAYQRAYSAPNAQAMFSRELQELMQAPAIRDAVKASTGRGANRAAAEGFKAVQNPFHEAADGAFKLRRRADGSLVAPTLQFWDQVKRNLDGMIGVAQRSGDKTYASDLMALKQKLVGSLDNAVPAYKAARQGAAAFFGAEDAVDAGKAFARSNRMLPEYKRGILAMKPAEKEAFETGFASELLDAAKNAGDRTNVINRMFGSQEAREKMVMAFGPSRAREIEAFVRVETAMDALRGAMGNSTTARQLIEAGVLGGGAWWYTGDFNTGLATAALSQGARMAGKKIDGNVMTHTAKMLLSDNPKLIERAIQNAAMSPQHMAAIDALTKAIGMSARVGGVYGTRELVAQ